MHPSLGFEILVGLGLDVHSALAVRMPFCLPGTEVQVLSACPPWESLVGSAVGSQDVRDGAEYGWLLFPGGTWDEVGAVQCSACLTWGALQARLDAFLWWPAKNWGLLIECTQAEQWRAAMLARCQGAAAAPLSCWRSKSHACWALRCRGAAIEGGIAQLCCR